MNPQFRLPAMVYCAMAAIELGDAEAASVLAPRLAPYAAQRANTGACAMPRTSDLLRELGS